MKMQEENKKKKSLSMIINTPFLTQKVDVAQFLKYGTALPTGK